MNVFTFLFLTATVAICAGVVRTWLTTRAEKRAADEGVEDTLLKIDRLEERIQVLEKIVTENRFDLKQQIDSL